MARDNKKNGQRPSIARNILRQLGILQDRMDSVYRDTYSANPQNGRDLDKLTRDIETNISNIMSRNSTDTNISQISQLYSIAKLKQTVNNSQTVNSINDFFENTALTDTIISSYTQNKWIKELDLEIDTILKYMPVLDEAIEAIKDSVLSADNFEKEYLTFKSLDTDPTELSKFNEEMKTYKKMYQLEKKTEIWYEEASKYGEVFIYKVPYARAMQVLQNRKGSTRNRQIGYTEQSIISESGGVPMEFKTDADIRSEFDSFKSLDVSHLANLKVEIHKNGLPLESAVSEATHIRDMLPVAESCSINEATHTMDKTVPDEFELSKEMKTKSAAATDGVIDPNKSQGSNIRVPGLLLKKLKRENIIMLYIDDICLGYYYLEFINDENHLGVNNETLFKRNSIASGLQSTIKTQDTNSTNQAVDNLLKYVSSMIINSIDDKFINDNPSMRDAIYSILKYNDIYNSAGLDAIRVTYIAPEDIEHIKFREDPDTHRGISDLYRSIIPAKLWICLSLAINLGILTRGQDKRVYYVKQNVETNIAQTLLTVINQIKKQNFNIMQIENMNSILGITGKYNDFIIPVGPSGDSPVQMEVMQGQDIDPQTELLEKLEETAVNGLGTTIDMVKSRLSLEYASQLTMSNTKHLRFVYKRQSAYEEFMGNIMTDIYNAEHAIDGDGHKKVITCILPAPVMLNLNNLNQIIDLVEQQAEKLAMYEYPDSNDEAIEIKRAIFKKNYIHYKLSGYIKLDELEAIKERTELEYAKSAKIEDALS